MWVIDPLGKNLEGAPISAKVRAEWQRIHNGSNRANFTPPKQHGDEISRNLDRITLEQHICERYQVSPETVRTFISPLAGGGSGLGADVLSGYSDYAADVVFPWQYDQGPQMFPGGNTGITRQMLKAVVPDAIPGPPTIPNVCRTPIQFSALDRRGQSTRLRNARHRNLHRTWTDHLSAQVQSASRI